MQRSDSTLALVRLQLKCDLGTTIADYAAEEIEKAIADIDRALAVPPFEFLWPDEMRRDFALALETYEATNAFYRENRRQAELLRP